MPERMRIAGLISAPAQMIVSRPQNSSESVATPTARFPSKRMRRTAVLAIIVRFDRARTTISRYPRAAETRRVPSEETDIGNQPSPNAPFWSAMASNRAFANASRDAFEKPGQLLSGTRVIRIGPLVPCKAASGASISVSSFRK